MEKWRIVISGETDPSLNMGIDYAIWDSARREKCPPTLRFYLWEPSSVSLGYNQSPEKVINVKFCKEHNIPIVRRPTGGSAIFHDIELTYSFSSHINSFSSFSSPLSSYISICKGLKKGIEEFGIKLEIRGYSDGKEPSFTEKACFVLSSRHDVICRGKKIIGSAQKRDKISFLQHGSILVGIRENLWMEIFSRKVDFGKVGSLNEFLKEKIMPEMLVQSIKRGFEEYFRIELSESSLTPEEEKNSLLFAEKFFHKL